MKNKWIYVPAGLAVVCLIGTFFLDKMGTLAGYAVNGLMLLFLGIYVLALGIDMRKSSKKTMMIGIVIGCLFLFFGGKSLVETGLDMAKGPVTVHLDECKAEEHQSVRRMYRAYYVKGSNPYGEEERYRINKETYRIFLGQREFSIDFLAWKHTGVIKEILYEGKG